MGNTRIMTLEDYDQKLDAEYQELSRALPGMRKELQKDPEGCFGGRGNNFGYAYVEDAENRLGWLISRGYSIRTHPHIDLLQAGIELVVEKVIARDDAIFIYGIEGYRRKKTLKSGAVAEVNWKYDRATRTWNGGKEPPQAVLDSAETVANHHDSTLMEWRGEFHVSRVYL